jgi:hypothetical protein
MALKLRHPQQHPGVTVAMPSLCVRRENIDVRLPACFRDGHGRLLTAMGGIEDLKVVNNVDLLENLIQIEEPDAVIMLFTATLKERSKVVVTSGSSWAQLI